MATFRDDPERLQLLLSRLEPRFRRRFLEVIEALRDERTLQQIQALIESGRISEAIISSEVAAIRLGRSWGEAYVLTGVETAAIIAEALELIVDFSSANPRALAAIQANELRLVREFTAQQVEATRQALIEGVAAGVNPREMARAFRDSIGLTSSQVSAVNNYRRLLEAGSRDALDRALRDHRFDRTVEAAIESGRPLTQAQIERMVERYRERYLRYRAETIARTEALSSVHEGTEEMYRQAIDSGTLDPRALTRFWITAKDTRVRDSHASMEGQQRPFGEPFLSGRGNLLKHPGDRSAPPEEVIQCRCVLGTVFSDSALLRELSS